MSADPFAPPAGRAPAPTRVRPGDVVKALLCVLVASAGASFAPVLAIGGVFVLADGDTVGGTLFVVAAGLSAAAGPALAAALFASRGWLVAAAAVFVGPPAWLGLLLMG